MHFQLGRFIVPYKIYYTTYIVCHKLAILSRFNLSIIGQYLAILKLGFHPRGDSESL